MCITCTRSCVAALLRALFLVCSYHKNDHGSRFLIMTDPTKQHGEKERALKKLIRKWLMAQETQGKAHALLSRNPGIKKSGRSGKES